MSSNYALRSVFLFFSESEDLLKVKVRVSVRFSASKLSAGKGSPGIGCRQSIYTTYAKNGNLLMICGGGALTSGAC